MARVKLFWGADKEVPTFQLQDWIQKTLADVEKQISKLEEKLKGMGKIKTKLRKYRKYRTYLLKELGAVREQKKPRKKEKEVEKVETEQTSTTIETKETTQ